MEFRRIPLIRVLNAFLRKPPPNTMFQVLKKRRKLPLLTTVYHKIIPLSIHSLCRALKRIPPDERHSLVKSAQSELKALQKENEKLRQDVDDLKQELQLTHGRKLSRDALTAT